MAGWPFFVYPDSQAAQAIPAERRLHPELITKPDVTRTPQFASYQFGKRFHLVLLGHGNSPGARMAIGDYESLLQEVESFLVYLKQRHPDSPIGLYGHRSWDFSSHNQRNRRQKNRSAKRLSYRSPPRSAGDRLGMF